jgi:hypothetical protein
MLGQLLGHNLPLVEKRQFGRSFFLLLAEREGFELKARLGLPDNPMLRSGPDQQQDYP